MLNKKAIAALAAGATLVSGLAFAAPAMAVEVKDCPVNKEEWNLKSVNEGIAAEAKTAWETAKAAVPAVPQEPQEPTKAEVKALYEADGNEGKLKMKTPLPNGTKPEDAAAAQAYVNQKNQYVADKANYDTKSAAATAAYNLYLKALGNVATCSNPDPTQDQKNQEMIDKVYASKHNLDNKDNDLAKAKKGFKGAYNAFVAALAEFNDREAAYVSAQEALADFLASGVKDSAKETALRDAMNRAEAHKNRAKAALAKAKQDFKDALSKDLAAVAAYNKALAEYKKIYNEAIAMGINPKDLPPVVTADPLDPSFPTVPGAKELYAEALSGKFGNAAQAAAKKATAKKGEAKKEAGKKGASAAAPAGAKLDTKAAAAASAAPLSKTGVTVMFTALAASMLAGIGAAVRKFRH